MLSFLVVLGFESAKVLAIVQGLNASVPIAIIKSVTRFNDGFCCKKAFVAESFYSLHPIHWSMSVRE